MQAGLASRREHPGHQASPSEDALEDRGLRSSDPKNATHVPRQQESAVVYVPAVPNRNEWVAPLSFETTANVGEDGKRPPKYELVLARLGEDVSW